MIDAANVTVLVFMLLLLGYQVATIVRCKLADRRSRTGPAAPAEKPPQHQSVQPGCACFVCQALRQDEILRANPALRMTPQLTSMVQSMLLIAASGTTPAVLRPFETLGPAGVGKTVLVAFNGAVFDQVVAPVLHSTFGVRNL